MDGTRVDQFARSLVMTGTRRGLLQTLATLPLGGALASVLADVEAARRRGNGSRRRRRARPEVVGGRTVPQGTFPFMAFIDITYSDGERSNCGGSLISPQFILTAAHCTDPDASVDPPVPVSTYVTRIGRVKVAEAGPANTFGVTAVHVHPKWDPATSQAFDAAVLRLDRPVPPEIGTPVPFVGAGDTRFNGTGQKVQVAGWGRISTGGQPSEDLLETDVYITSDADCNAAYTPGFDPQSMICAWAPARDSCQGDSGGPLFATDIVGTRIEKIKKKKRKGKKRKVKKREVPVIGQTQVGIVSFGQLCADPVYPGVYARVSDPEINSFIRGVIGG